MSDSPSTGAGKQPLSLKAVYFRKASAQVFDWFDQTIPGQKLVGKYRISGGRVDTMEVSELTNPSAKSHFCRFVTSFEFQYLLEKVGEPGVPDEQKVAAEVLADIAVNYAVTDSTPPQGALLERWGQTNVLLHSWPYWREFCQSSLGRLQLPGTVLPLLDPLAAGKVDE